MKSTTFLAAFGGLAFVTASLVPTGLVEEPLKRGIGFTWDPPDPYSKTPYKRSFWEKACLEVLAREGCGFGIIHQGKRKLIKPNGNKTSYINIEGAPFSDMKNSKKMRVFEDGSSTYGWSRKDLKVMAEGKRLKKGTQPPKDQKALLSWDPIGAYKNQASRKTFWEQKCDQALTREGEGCKFGIIHKGETKLIRNGEKTSYVNVEGRSSMETKDSKKMRVFQDGSSTYGWSPRDHKLMTVAKRPRLKQAIPPVNPPSETTQPLEGNTAISWDPVDAYQNQRKWKAVWEQRCDKALIREGCLLGIIHQGETKFTTPTGEKTRYVKVEGAPFVGHEYETKLRVFQDGSSTKGWDERDRRLIAKAKRPRHTERRIRLKLSMHDPVEARTSTQASAQDSSKHRISWHPPDQYKHYPVLRQAYEKACHEALEREGCDFGVIHRGQHRLDKADGTKPLYVNVLAGNNHDPDTASYMRLFEDGASEWYPPGQLPIKRERRGWGLTPDQRRARSKGRSSSTSSQSPSQAPAQGALDPGLVQALAPTQTPFQEEYPQQAQAPGEGHRRDSAIRAFTPYSGYPTQDNFKRRRVGEGE